MIMPKTLELGESIYLSVARFMNAQTETYREFVEAGEHLTEEEKTARILEIVKDNLSVLWPLFLVVTVNRKRNSE